MPRSPLGGRSRALALIEDVVVDSCCRGTGLGRALVERLVAIAAECGCTHAALNCSQDKLRFYEKCGFEAAPEGKVGYTKYLS